MKPRVLEISTFGPGQTESVGGAMGRLLRAGDVIRLHGPLGAGKTCLVRGLASGLGLEPRQVSSPTFVIVNRYTQPGPGVASIDATPLCHVDAYRLSGPDDLDSVGWERVMDGSSVVAIEWAERVGVQRPPNAQTGKEPEDDTTSCDVTLTPEGPERRRIAIQLPGHWMDRRGAEHLERAASFNRCRVCGRDIAPQSQEYPFCSARCKAADLGGWLTGRYVVKEPPPSGS